MLRSNLEFTTCQELPSSELIWLVDHQIDDQQACHTYDAHVNSSLRPSTAYRCKTSMHAYGSSAGSSLIMHMIANVHATIACTPFFKFRLSFVERCNDKSHCRLLLAQQCSCPIYIAMSSIQYSSYMSDTGIFLFVPVVVSMLPLGMVTKPIKNPLAKCALYQGMMHATAATIYDWG